MKGCKPHITHKGNRAWLLQEGILKSKGKKIKDIFLSFIYVDLLTTYRKSISVRDLMQRSVVYVKIWNKLRNVTLMVTPIANLTGSSIPWNIPGHLCERIQTGLNEIGRPTLTAGGNIPRLNETEKASWGSPLLPGCRGNVTCHLMLYQMQSLPCSTLPLWTKTNFSFLKLHLSKQWEQSLI
jgi:hypothetical protein